MKLTIKNIDSIENVSLPNLNGYSISWGKTDEGMYEFDVFLNHTIKMVISVDRISNYFNSDGDTNKYICKINAGGIYNTHKWQVVLDRSQFGTRLGFLMIASSMVAKILLQQMNEGKYMAHSVSI